MWRTFSFAIQCAWLILLLLPAAAHADELRPGYLEISETAKSQYQINWKAPSRNQSTSNTTPIFPEFCEIEDGSIEAPANRLSPAKWRINCAGSLLGQSVQIDGLAGSQDDVLLRFIPLEGERQTGRMTPDSIGFTIAAKPQNLQIVRAYTVLGIEHIVTGWDHLLFVLCLVLLLRGGWVIAKTITAFTIAHSLTLIGTTLDWVRVPSAPVEAVIALSIMFLAVEIIKAKPDAPRLSERYPWVVAFLFGLLHGFGFAGALAEIGVPKDDVITALLTFNIGVEIGQLLIVGVALLCLALLARLLPSLRPIRRYSAYAIGIIASYWFIERIWL